MIVKFIFSSVRLIQVFLRNFSQMVFTCKILITRTVIFHVFAPQFVLWKSSLFRKTGLLNCGKLRYQKSIVPLPFFLMIEIDLPYQEPILFSLSWILYSQFEIVREVIVFGYFRNIALQDYRIITNKKIMI